MSINKNLFLSLKFAVEIVLILSTVQKMKKMKKKKWEKFYSSVNLMHHKKDSQCANKKKITREVIMKFDLLRFLFLHAARLLAFDAASLININSNHYDDDAEKEKEMQKS